MLPSKFFWVWHQKKAHARQIFIKYQTTVIWSVIINSVRHFGFKLHVYSFYFCYVHSGIGALYSSPIFFSIKVKVLLSQRIKFYVNDIKLIVYGSKNTNTPIKSNVKIKEKWHFIVQNVDCFKLRVTKIKSIGSNK